MQPEIDQVVKEAVEAGYSVVFKAFNGGLTYTIICPDGCGYGRGIKWYGDFSLSGCLSGPVLDSLQKTLKVLPEWESAKGEHIKAEPQEMWAV